ncbi:SulP family inorganic anion transporter [Sulfurospirillum diekertiae]|uniref:C4-dicarboxylic acid transporter DauA n=1 Tax=Sulfurospirillum diekertiae TaxID=1854492 RepID=A0A1Y0HMP6_9BACT|nr:sulfate permease [Sulfurospirillum diekertiae]ARU48605.1 C4-dicarboxylic acid transporter DauA [Sulfurospirillum diekertiae]ASC93435.1 C4-dicarboxylic acid transporter DauA [Sulfurospirillum diekertiae]
MNIKYWLPRSFTVLREGYSVAKLSSDIVAGSTVAIIALPLAMAFAIASGVSPEKGLFTAVVAGIIISLFGGSRYQIGGPTGAFVVVLYAVILKHGYDGLVIATFLAGIMLFFMGIFRLGNIIKYIPYPVTVGFTTGIALIIFSSQIKDFLGLPIAKMPAEFIDQWKLYSIEFLHVNYYALAIGAVSMALLIKLRHRFPHIPTPIIVIILSALAVYLFKLPVETIGSKFGTLPATLPYPSIPAFSLEKVRAVFPDAITIALLGAIESLLSCVVADGMTGDRHHSNKELMAQGAANIASVLFGGIAATGAIARTATNIKAGAYSPIAGVVHSLMLLIFMFLFSKFIVLIPLATLAAILIVVAWNMSEFHHFKAIALKSERNDIVVLLMTFFLTVLIDLNTGVQTGIMLAGLLFIKRMIDVTGIVDTKNTIGMPLDEDDEPLEVEDTNAISKKIVPKDVEVYEIDGPFFFGVADRLKNILSEVSQAPKVFILRMRHVPMIDATGLHALDEFFDLCQGNGTILVLSGVNEHIKLKIRRLGFEKKIGTENITDNIDMALSRAHRLLEKE